MDNNKNLPKIVEQEEEFPPPPDKPQKPVNFSWKLAMENPHSNSALYLDELDNWRDLMIMYNQMLAQYDVEMLRENMTNFFDILLESDKLDDLKGNSLMTSVKKYIEDTYHLGDHTDKFIDEMANDNSINLDDLVGYYKYKHGLINN